MPPKFIIFLFYSFCGTSSLFSQELQLKIEGENTAETKTIDSVGYTRFFNSFSELENELDTVFFQIQKSGYIDAEIVNVKKENDSLYNTVFHLNQQYKSIKLNYSLSPEEKKALAHLTDEVTEDFFTTPIYNTETILEQLVFLKTKNGDPFFSLQLNNIKKENGNISAEISSSTTAIRTIDKIIIEGYENFPSSFIKHYLKIKNGQVFDKEKLTRRANRVQNLPFVTQSKPPEILFTKDSTTAYLYLQKQNSNIFDGFLGFSNSENGQLVFNGNINLQLYNNLNFGEKLNIQYRSDGNEQINFNAGAELPYILKTPIGITAGLNIFKQDSTFLNVGQKINATYSFSGTSVVHAGYKANSSTNLRDNSDVVPTNVVEYNSQFFNFGAAYEERNASSTLFPVKTAVFLDADIGTRQTHTNINQQILRLNGTHNLYISNRSSFYINNINNYLFSKEYIENELFRFGGINSLRGYLENSIYANYFSSIQTEFRYVLSPNLYAHTILDAAYYENELLGQKRSLLGFGFGLGLNTRSGLLRVSLANGSFEDENFRFSNSKIHISLTVQF